MEEKWRHDKMNELSKRNRFETICSKEAIAVISSLDSRDELCAIHETYYPDTRKDICLVKKTFVLLNESYDILYLLWKKNKGIEIKKIWSTSVYDPPGQQHLIVSYMHEESRKIVIKIYFAGKYSSRSPGENPILHEISKQQLGIN
jgi:hypothetical protein